MVRPRAGEIIFAFDVLLPWFYALFDRLAELLSKLFKLLGMLPFLVEFLSIGSIWSAPGYTSTPFYSQSGGAPFLLFLWSIFMNLLAFGLIYIISYVYASINVPLGLEDCDALRLILSSWAAFTWRSSTILRWLILRLFYRLLPLLVWCTNAALFVLEATSFLFWFLLFFLGE